MSDVSAPADAPSSHAAPAAGGPGARRRALRGAALVAAEAAGGILLALLALDFAHPLARGSARTHIWGAHVDVYSGGGDLSGTLFLIARSLFGESGRSTRLLGWPFSRGLEGEFYNTLVTDLMAPVVGAFDWPLGYNLAILLILLSNALACQLAARLGGAGIGGGLIAATVAAPSAMAINEILEGRPVTAWWGPAIAATALCAAAIGRWRHLPALAVGLALLWTALEIYPYGPVLLAPWTLLVGLSVTLLGGPTAPKGAAASGAEDAGAPPWRAGALRLGGRTFRALIGAGLAAGVLYLYLEASGKGTGDFARNPLEDDTLPPFRTLRYDDLLFMGIGGVQIPRIPASLSAAALGLGLVGIRQIHRWGPPLLGAIALMLVAMGPAFDFGDGDPSRVHPQAPYVLLMNHVPALRPCYRPDRYAIGATVLLAVALGIAASAAAGSLRWGWGRIGGALEARISPALARLSRVAPSALGLVVAALACWWVLVQSRPSMAPHLLDWPPVPGLEDLADEEAILDLPLVMMNDKGEMMMVASLTVKRANPTRIGLQAWRRRLGDEHPLLQAAAAAHAGELEEADVAGLREAIPEVAAGLRYAVLHPNAADAATIERYRQLMAWIGAEGEARDRGVVVYRLPGVE